VSSVVCVKSIRNNRAERVTVHSKNLKSDTVLSEGMACPNNLVVVQDPLEDDRARVR
jgi:hypothetical protein